MINVLYFRKFISNYIVVQAAIEENQNLLLLYTVNKIVICLGLVNLYYYW